MRTTGLERMARKLRFAWRSPLADPVHVGLVSADIENGLKDSAFGSIRIFGHDGPPVRAKFGRGILPTSADPFEVACT